MSLAAAPHFLRTNLRCLAHERYAQKVGGSPYSEVTDAILPSSLKRVLSCALGYSPYPPVSV
ncbi:TPA: hypothetical protein DCX20_01420 [Patescibacteria group bacterium]|nr:hypothetical protein [Patescibacteria group bacterium]